jgi:hypothetical protein
LSPVWYVVTSRARLFMAQIWASCSCALSSGDIVNFLFGLFLHPDQGGQLFAGAKNAACDLPQLWLRQQRLLDVQGVALDLRQDLPVDARSGVGVCGP